MDVFLLQELGSKAFSRHNYSGKVPGSPTKDEVVTSLKKRELFPFPPVLTCIVVSLAEHQLWGLTPECECQ